jgi:hypothetical protein
MATLGFELCHEAHLQNTAQWDRERGRNNSRRGSASQGRRSSRMQDFSLFSFRHSNGLDDGDKSTTSSHFTNDTTETTYSDRVRRKRRCALRLMAGYMSAAGLTFLLVVLWKQGIIFKKSDDSLNAITSTSNRNGFDDSGNMICNGLTLNCHRRANEIMYATVHNAMSSRENSFLAYNNLYPLEQALAAGFRGLTIDSCDCARIGIQLCHSVCVAGFRRPVGTFTAIVEFMQANPHEVVVIEIEVGDESLGPLFDDLQQVPGLFDLMYQHPGGEEKWPLLKDMIAMDKVRRITVPSIVNTRVKLNRFSLS